MLGPNPTNFGRHTHLKAHEKTHVQKKAHAQVEPMDDAPFSNNNITDVAIGDSSPESVTRATQTFLVTFVAWFG